MLVFSVLISHYLFLCLRVSLKMAANESQEDPMSIGPPGWRVEARPRNNEKYLGKIDWVGTLYYLLNLVLGLCIHLKY